MGLSERAEDPTLKQIKERCERIQAGWSEAVRAKRAVAKPQRQSYPPTYDRDFLDAIESEQAGCTRALVRGV